jgi:hypothetical protein
MNPYYKKVLKVRKSILHLLFVHLQYQLCDTPSWHLVYSSAVPWELGLSVVMMVYLARLVCLMKCLPLTKIIALYVPLTSFGCSVLRLNTDSVVVSVGNWQDGATAVCVWILGQMVSIQSPGEKNCTHNCSTSQSIGPGDFFCLVL